MVEDLTLWFFSTGFLTGTVVLMIGASLIGSSGAPNWAGGSNDCEGRPATGLFALCPDINAPRPLPYVFPLKVYAVNRKRELNFSPFFL